MAERGDIDDSAVELPKDARSDPEALRRVIERERVEAAAELARLRAKRAEGERRR